MIKLNVFVPTLNRLDLLFELVESLAPQADDIECLHILDNGKQDCMQLSYPGRWFLQNSPRNLGVAASWNEGLDFAFAGSKATHVLVLNDDIVLYQDQIAKIKKFIADNPGQFYCGRFNWSVWAMERSVWKHFKDANGWVFDPAFYPAYCEDNDFHRRIDQQGIKYLGGIKELTPEICRNSMTAKAKPVITHDRSVAYYRLKWGGSPGNEKWEVPFNGKGNYTTI